MNTKPEERAHLPEYATRFPYVNGGLFRDRTKVPKISKRALRCDAKSREPFRRLRRTTLRHSMPGAGVVHNIIRDGVLQLLSAASISQPPRNSAELFLTGQPVRHGHR